MKPIQHQIIASDMREIRAKTPFADQLRDTSFFISGSTGMIASYIIYFLCFLNDVEKMNIQIFAGARNEEKAVSIFGDLLQEDYFHLVLGDVNEEPDVGDANIDYVIHAASLASPQYYGTNPVEVMLPNLLGTNALLRLGQKKECKGFLFFSSGAVYGDVHGCQSVSESMYGLLDYSAPGNVYSESKRAGEALCLAYKREYGVPVKLIRICHTFGPTMDLDRDQRAFSEFIKRSLAGENIRMRTAGLAKRAYCYISDALPVLLAVLTNGKDGEAYNLVNPNNYVSTLELAQTIVSLCGGRTSIEFVERSGSKFLDLAQHSSVVCSSEKTSELGCCFSISLREGLSRVIAYKSETKPID